MASDQGFVDDVCHQIGLASELTFRKMFGEYALYLNGTVVAFVCDNQLFVKPTAEGRHVLGTVAEHPPFPGAKAYFRIDDELEDRALMERVLRATAAAAPPAKAKKAKANRATSTSAKRKASKPAS